MAEFVNKETLFDPSESFKASQAMPLMRDGFFEPVRQLDGGKPTEDVAIQDNSIAPSAADVRVDTEEEAPADDLQTISLLNTNNGMHVRLWAKDDTRTVTLKHSTEQLYGIRLAGETDKQLSTTSYIELKRDGDYWNEIVSDSVTNQSVPLAASPSEEHPDGVAGLVVPDGETVQIENGLLKSRIGGFFPGQIVYSSMNTLPDGDKFIFIDGVGGQPGLLPRAAYQGFIDNWLSRPENAALWVADSVWQAEVSTFGFTLKYSKGDGSTTWRPPFLQECFLGAAGVGRPMGSARKDQIIEHAHRISSGTYKDAEGPQQVASGNYRGSGGAVLTYGLAEVDAESSLQFQAYKIFNPTTGLFNLQVGDRTEPRSVYGRVMLCVANSNINVTEQNIQVLVDSLVHKLDSSDYAANNTYSTSEVNTGKKWIDGRTVYRKYVNFGALPNGTTKSVAHGIIDMDITTAMLRVHWGSSSVIQMDGTSAWFDSALLWDMSSTIIRASLASGKNLSSYTAFCIIEYCKTS